VINNSIEKEIDMLIEKKLYITIVRERTNERIKAPLGPVMNRIKTYDEKQSFMNMLGQDTFWKKNRLDLWNELKTLEIDDYQLQGDVDCIWLTQVAFQNTPIMLATIKERLTHEVQNMIEHRRRIPTTNWEYSDYNHIYSNGERKYVDRAVRIDVPNHYIRTEDVEKFDQELSKLLDKYVVKDPTRLRNGKQRFNIRTLSNRYVERVYGFKPEPKNSYYW
jgi:hypothetical protein